MAAVVPFHWICVRKALVTMGAEPYKLLVRPLYKLVRPVSLFGKFGDVVQPVTYALPKPSTAMLLATSLFVPPRKVEHTKLVPVESNLATNAFVQPFKYGWKAFKFGKFIEAVNPVT